MKLKTFCSIAVLSLMLPLKAMAGNCALVEEKAALDVRALQTQLMVAALSCGEQARYNEFMKKFGKQLSMQGDDLKHYFSRVYSTDSERQKNSFITKLANTSSQLSLKEDEDEFCETASAMFDDVIGAKPVEMPKLASLAGAESLHGIRGCSGN